MILWSALLRKLLQAYKTELLDDDHFPNCFNFAVSKIHAQEANNVPFCLSREKFHAVIFKGVRQKKCRITFSCCNTAFGLFFAC